MLGVICFDGYKWRQFRAHAKLVKQWDKLQGLWVTQLASTRWQVQFNFQIGRRLDKDLPSIIHVRVSDTPLTSSYVSAVIINFNLIK